MTDKTKIDWDSLDWSEIVKFDVEREPSEDRWHIKGILKDGKKVIFFDTAHEGLFKVLAQRLQLAHDLETKAYSTVWEVSRVIDKFKDDQLKRFMKKSLPERLEIIKKLIRKEII